MGDLRTRAGREAEVIERIRAWGGATVFWLTENQKRAHATERLEAAGRIVRDRSATNDKYPWCVFRLNEEADRG